MSREPTNGVGSSEPPITSENRDGLRVLIVEDYDDCAESMAVLLVLFGHNVRIACNGHGAIAAIEDFDPDVVLLDLGLPGMSGLELARRICRPKTRTRQLIVAVTGHARQCDRDDTRDAGIDLHLAKPVDPGVLKATLQQFQQTLRSETH